VEIVKIFLGEGGDIELGVRTSKIILKFVFGYLSQLYTCYILHYSYCLYIYTWYYAHTYFTQESYWSTSTLKKEESCEKVL